MFNYSLIGLHALMYNFHVVCHIQDSDLALLQASTQDDQTEATEELTATSTAGAAAPIVEELETKNADGKNETTSTTGAAAPIVEELEAQNADSKKTAGAAAAIVEELEAQNADGKKSNVGRQRPCSVCMLLL